MKSHKCNETKPKSITGFIISQQKLTRKTGFERKHILSVLADKGHQVHLRLILRPTCQYPCLYYVDVCDVMSWLLSRLKPIGSVAG